MTNRFRKLWLPLTELLECLQDLEPHDTPVTDVAITRKPEGGVSIAYHAHPARLVVIDNGKRYTLLVEDVNGQE